MQCRDVFDYLDRLGIWVCSGVLVVKTVDICHQEQHIGVDHGGSDSRESIVVTELDLGNGKSVVFVDNWNDSLL